MFYTQNRNEQRQFLNITWQKFCQQKNLTPFEIQLASVIEIHPEYHNLITQTEANYFPEQGAVNPFLHLNLHLALREQLSINQPQGIQTHYQKILKKIKDLHQAEHLMMDCIAQMIFISQKNNTQMDVDGYFECLNLIDQ